MHQLLNGVSVDFQTCEEVAPALKRACDAHPNLAKYEVIGTSEEDRPIVAVVLGKGATKISLIAGAHSDEPVGPETLLTLIIAGSARHEELADLFDRYTFLVVPHINPDGAARNERWKEAWPSVQAYLTHVFREPPGRDIEFGFPDMRPENAAVADFLTSHGPVALHMSLHGMSFAEGALLLIERHWVDRTEKLRRQFREAVEEYGLRLHDHDRGGEKGFRYIGPGFSTTPEGVAMRAHFEALNDHETAALFKDSSMEFVHKLGGDPLCLVTEIPLFVIGKTVENQPKGVPQAYLDLRQQLPELAMKASQGKPIQNIVEQFQLQAFPLRSAVALQLLTIQFGLEAIEEQ